MTVKEQVLELLENNKGTYYSGEEIGQMIFVSRNTVWKAVKSLQAEGYDIQAVTNKGYCLSETTDKLSVTVIEKYLERKWVDWQLELHQTIPSTNGYGKDMAAMGAPEGTVIVSEEQTIGRGRLGKSFYSPANTGIYMSIILRPDIPITDAVLLTTMAAVAVSESVEAISSEQVGIKWVNDLFIGDKKVCGILTEASFTLENTDLEYIVLGIGVNVFTPKTGFPQELSSIATSIFGKQQKDIRNLLIGEILNRIESYYINFSEKTFLFPYKQRSNLIGKNITVMEKGKEYQGVALDIDDNCKLKIKTIDGTEKLLSSGEVQIRL